ncbi:MAG: hypothetical protein COA43_10020 [Robiginitomaculum sp.]|nr:MAG: hypothetical protein COA43_10020 [Robiginitomaculum sp.]
MSTTQSTPKFLEPNLLSRLRKNDTVIMKYGQTSDVFVAHARGDKRSRPIAWIEASTIKKMIDAGVLKKLSGHSHATSEKYVVV